MVIRATPYQIQVNIRIFIDGWFKFFLHSGSKNTLRRSSLHRQCSPKICTLESLVFIHIGPKTVSALTCSHTFFLTKKYCNLKSDSWVDGLLSLKVVTAAVEFEFSDESVGVWVKLGGGNWLFEGIAFDIVVGYFRNDFFAEFLWFYQFIHAFSMWIIYFPWAYQYFSLIISYRYKMNSNSVTP